MRFPCPIGYCAVLVLCAVPALAREPADFRPLSLTIDPLLIVILVYQFTLEYRPAPHWSGAVLAGLTPVETYLSSESTGWEAGAQARAYPWPGGKSEYFGMLEGRYGRSNSSAGERGYSETVLGTLTAG